MKINSTPTTMNQKYENTTNDPKAQNNIVKHKNHKIGENTTNKHKHSNQLFSHGRDLLHNLNTTSQGATIRSNP